MKQFRDDFEVGLARFVDEARSLARFDHRHIVRLFRSFKAHGTAYIVMEYAEGETLSNFAEGKGTLRETELKAILYPILDGLEVMHRADNLHRKGNPFATATQERMTADDRSTHRRDIYRRHPFFKGSWKWRIGAICLCAVLLGVIYHPEYVPGQRGQQQAARQPSVLKSGAGVDVASGRLPRWLGNEGWETSRAVPEPAADDEMVAQGKDGIVGRFHAMLKAILSRRVNDKPGEYGSRNRGIRADAPLLSVLSTARSQAEASEVKRQRSAGTVFRDCEECPQMVVLPSGSFMMGSPDGEEGRDEDESPRHLVKIEYRFAVGVYEVTFDEWEACVAAGGCGGYVPNDKNWGRGERPVINVSWDDAQSYVSWLSKRTGVSYRLLSESEWEYAACLQRGAPRRQARAGTTTRYSWGG